MRRLASHYVYWQQPYRMSYLELDDENRFRGVYPLVEEIASTAFYDGIVLPITEGTPESFHSLLCTLHEAHPQMGLFDLLSLSAITGAVQSGRVVRLLRLSGFPLSATEFSAYDSCRNGHVERL